MRTLPLTLLVLATLGCRNKTDDAYYGDPLSNVSAKLERFSDCGDFSDSLVDSYLEELVQSRYGYYAYPEADAGGDDGGQNGPADYSTTNVQEEGVDEPDIVKTDGTWLYVVQTTRPELTILASWPPESTAVVGRIPLDGYPYSAFLRGDRMAVFQYVYSDTGGGTEPDGGYVGSDTPVRSGYGTRVSIIDVTDRTAPVLLEDIDMEGWMSDARLIEQDAYIVLNSWIDMPQDLWDLAWRDDLGLPEPDWNLDDDAQAAQRAAARAILRPYVQAVVDGMDVTTLLPRAYVNDGAWDDGSNLLECTDVYHPDGTAQPGLLALVHLDLDTDRPEPTASGLFANGWTVYASTDNLYVAQSSWWWSWGWGDDPLTTHIHQFALDAADTVYAASGEVDGWLLDQFSMSEYDGDLRVATTETDWWWGTESSSDLNGNGVYVLRPNAGSLDVIGSVTGLAPDEQIYAARFSGDQGWLVTFRQTDPLFALDLSEPTNPRVVGELELPGFSSYMHPLDGGYLLTVGMAGEDDGTITGFAVKLFDVRDPTAPSLVDELVATSDEWSWSDALWDHHAFTFHNGVLSVPLYTYDYDEASSTYTGFSGLWVIQVDTAAGLTELGRVDHADLVDESECLYDWYGTGCESSYWYAWMRRSVIMEDKLYSISDYGVKVSELLAPEDTVTSALFWPRG